MYVYIFIFNAIQTCGEQFFDFIIQNLRAISIIGGAFAAFEVSTI